MPPLRLLLLGGTAEASALARALADDARIDVTLSLAGRTRDPVLPPVAHRSGGFGGVAGLTAFLATERIGALVDATHPFAAMMSAHAAAAARQSGVPLLVLRRPEWAPVEDDRWIQVASMAAAAAALGVQPRRVLLTIGQRDLAAFAVAPQHDYLIRSVEPPDPAALPLRAKTIAARGPFALEDEITLLRDRAIQILVTKNSGGTATAAKLAAARALGLPVIMVARPPPPPAPTVEDVAQALAWVHETSARVRGV